MSSNTKRSQWVLMHCPCNIGYFDNGSKVTNFKKCEIGKYWSL